MSDVSHVDLDEEVSLVARRFDECLRRASDAGTARASDPGIRRDNIAVMLPYFLAEALPFPGDLRASRTMAVANALGAAHYLMQDRFIDGDEALSPAALELSDRLLVGFVREYGGLRDLGEGFWGDFGRYLAQYSRSLSWEVDVLRTPRGRVAVSDDSIARTLKRLGHRMALLKTSGAAATRLAGRPDALEPIERFVDSFHAGYQLTDDLEDLEVDLARGRWSVVAWMITRAAGEAEPNALGDPREAHAAAASSGALQSVTRLILSEYQRAHEAARSLGSPSLVGFMERLVERSSWELTRLERRLRLAVGHSLAPIAAPETPPEGPTRVGAAGERALDATMRPVVPAAATDVRSPGGPGLLEGIHRFSVGGQGYVYDVASGLLFEADPLAARLIDWLEGGAEPVDLRVLEMNHGAEQVREGLAEIALFGGPAADAPGPLRARWEAAGSVRLSSLALHLTHRCNLRCDYCYLRRDGSSEATMSEETAIRAVDLLLEESAGERAVSIVFFGGEPLLCPDLIERVVEHATSAGGSRRRVMFHLTTNGTLLSPAIAARLSEMGVRILVSIDGPESDHDRHRVFPDGRGSYRQLAARLAALPPGARAGARATVTTESSRLRDVVAHLSELGCSIIHLAPVSGVEMTPGFAKRLVGEYEELARDELDRMRAGERPRVGNFLEAMVSLEAGRVRSLPCGAGSRYLSVSADGELFLCHRFGGDAAHAVGDVSRGIDRRKVRLLLERLGAPRRRCEPCWARWLCGGPCYYDLRTGSSLSAGPKAPRCVVRTRILELAMWLYASLAPGDRERVIGSGSGGVGDRPRADGDGASDAARAAGAEGVLARS